MLSMSAFSCTQFEQLCKCDGSAFKCEEDTCKAALTCSDTTPCPGLAVCNEGRCVECVMDTDCAGDSKCVVSACTKACEKDEVCPLFHQCQAGGCVDVGCQTDRECKTFLRDIRAVCSEGECRSVCSSDFECNPAGGNNSNSVCINGACVDAGCETDEECRIRLGNAVSRYEVECRPAKVSSP